MILVGSWMVELDFRVLASTSIKIMTHDWVCKGQRRLNMYSVFGDQIKSLSSNPSNWSFKTHYTQNLHFYAACWHKQPPDYQTIQPNQFWKIWLTRVFLDPVYEWSDLFLIYGGRFFNKTEYFGADWQNLLLTKSKI